MKRQNLIIGIVALLVLIVVNSFVWQRESQAATGQLLLLELTPVDPRSLIQGDYMHLQYAIAREIGDQTTDRAGYVVIQRDQNDVAHFRRAYEPNQPLAADEHLLRYRRRIASSRFGIVVAPTSFFFQEGHAAYYESAEYGEFRLSDSGELLLVGLRDSEFRELGPPE